MKKLTKSEKDYRAWVILNSPMSENKVFVIGLDGATLDVIRPWAREGKLPNLAKIMTQGSFGTLRSTIHPLTAPAWTSFMTGKNPGKHGIFDFISLVPSSHQIRYNNALTRKSPSLWRLLSDAGRKVIVVNVPFTFPPEEVNGILISGLDTPSTESVFTYPPSIREEIKKSFGDYVIMAQYKQGKGLKGYVSAIFQMIEKRTAAVKHLLKNYPWDFFMVVFSATDIVQHTFWKYMDQNHPQYNKDGAVQYGNVILDVYRKIDSEIGHLMESFDERTTLIIMSDHGAGPLKKVIYLNKWLEQHNLLHFCQSNNKVLESTALARKLLGKCKKNLPKSAKNIISKVFPEIKSKVDSYLATSFIDWSRTKAFSFGVHGNIIINLRGRQPQGTVQQGTEYEDLRSEIITRLSTLADPETGEAVVEKVHRREELYHGNYVQDAPDIIIQWKDYAYTAQKDFGEGVKSVFQARDKFEFSEIEHNGSHRLDGVLMMSGKPIKVGTEIKGSEIIDLAPTILYLMGMEIPVEMDGKILTSALIKDYTETHPIVYGKTIHEDTVEAVTTYSHEEAEKIERRLKDLGYL
ncbi:MAG TPA: alkaline phosphatase family protein [Thermodesulfovibrionales bacterium]|nr:alkaline phosphatase family protein [Thermodesulfovibrionales bacterium]